MENLQTWIKSIDGELTNIANGVSICIDEDGPDREIVINGNSRMILACDLSLGEALELLGRIKDDLLEKGHDVIDCEAMI